MRAKLAKIIDFDILVQEGEAEVEVVGTKVGRNIYPVHEFVGQTDIRMVMVATGGEGKLIRDTFRAIQNQSL